MRDAHESAEVVAREAALVLMLLPLALLLGADPTSGSAEEAAGIWFEQAATSQVVWTARKQGGLWDVRNRLGAWRSVQKLMSDFPIKPRRGQQAEPADASEDAASTPAQGSNR